MTDETTATTTPSGKAPVSERQEDTRVPISVKGQKYVAPAGRHSQQTHSRAQARAAAMGNSSEKEQHDHDRNAFVAELNRVEEQKTRQKSGQGKQSAAAKAPTEAAPEQK